MVTIEPRGHEEHEGGRRGKKIDTRNIGEAATFAIPFVLLSLLFLRALRVFVVGKE
jgi:hypothetical protein